MVELMKIKILPILIVLCVFSLVAETAYSQRKKSTSKKTPAAPTQQKTGPLDFGTILTGLKAPDGKGDFKNRAERIGFIVSLIKQRGVSFVLTPASEGELRAAGANDELIAAIRKVNEGSVVAVVVKRTGDDVKKSADAHLAKGEYDAAIKDYISAVEEYKLDRDPDIYYGRGLAYYFKGNYSSALNDLGQAIALKPDYPDANKYHGLANYKSRYYDMAITDFDKMIASEPNNAEAYNYRGLAYAAKGKCDPAIRDYNKAIRENAEYAEAYNNRGVCQKDTDRNGAIKDFEAAIRINPSYADAHFNRGKVYFDKGDNDKAVEDYNRAIVLDPRHAEAYNARGEYYSKKDKHDLAIEDYNKAIDIRSGYAIAWFNRGNAYFARENYSQAAADFERARLLDPSIKDVQENYEKAVKKAKKN
jgi:tetratricopeptide (TPR) repeat protein